MPGEGGRHNQIPQKTRPQLFELVADKTAIQHVRELYRRELLRADEKNLDPLAVATWAAFLHTNPEAEASIIEQLRGSQEYKNKHLVPKLTIDEN